MPASRWVLRALIFPLLATGLLSAQPDMLWTRTYGGPRGEAGYSVQQASDGGFIVVGFTESFGAGGRDVYVVRTDANGDTLWTRAYGGPANDEGRSILPASDGGWLISGFTESFGAGGNNVYLVGTDSTGDTLWTRTYGGTGDDRGLSAVRTPDGGYVITGSSVSSDTTRMAVLLLRTDAQGESLWARTFSSEDWEQWGNSVCLTTDGGYLVAGGSAEPEMTAAASLWKSDAEGNLQWQSGFLQADFASGSASIECADGGYAVTGSAGSYGGWQGIRLVRFDARGEQLWYRSYNGPLEAGEVGAASGQSILQTADGSFIITGWTGTEMGSRSLYVLKTDAGGDTLWTGIWGGTAGGAGHCIRPTADSGFVIAGVVGDDWGSGGELYLLRIAPCTR